MDRDIGRIEARLDALEKTQKKLEDSIKGRLDDVDTSLTTIKNLLQQLKGAGKVGGWLIAGVTAVGAAVIALAEFFGITVSFIK